MCSDLPISSVIKGYCIKECTRAYVREKDAGGHAQMWALLLAAELIKIRAAASAANKLLNALSVIY